jgi:mRNA-degrading endonuclease RelE of RelBE toxin-antitoxin system
MNFKIVLTPEFEKELKKLSKKHLSLKGDLLKLLASLKENPATGKALGNDAYKIRLAISSKNKGKSGGARVITFVKIIDEVIYLISIYDKSDTDTISDNEILRRVKLFK